MSSGFSTDGALISASAAPHYGEEVGRQYQEMDRPGVRQIPEGGVEQRKMEETGCEVVCDAPSTLAVKA